MFGVYLNNGEPLPQEGSYFVVARNGAFLRKDNGVVSGFVKVDRIGVLEPFQTDQDIAYHLPKIDVGIIAKIQSFFREVVKRYDAESCVTLFYDTEVQKFHAVVPQQVVSKGGVRYNRPAISHSHPTWQQVGTIHSHCDFAAFHSSTDVSDEVSFDGLHATFGHNDQEIISITASLVLNGRRCKIDPETVMEGIEHIDGEFYKVPPVTSDEIEGILQQVYSDNRELTDEIMIFEGANIER